MGFWDTRILPFLVEKACRSSAILEERKRLVPRARGEILEIGVGSGLNLAFYDEAYATRVIGVDPSAALLAKANPRARSAKIPVELVRCGAEDLPFDAARFDDAVMTYSLCSIGDPARALAEIRRVLRPGGRLFFVEHGVAPDPGPRRWQRRITPAWRVVSGNCHLDRDPAGAIGDAGFAIDTLATGYTDGPKWMTYTFEGVALAPR